MNFREHVHLCQVQIRVPTGALQRHPCYTFNEVHLWYDTFVRVQRPIAFPHVRVSEEVSCLTQTGFRKLIPAKILVPLDLYTGWARLIRTRLILSSTLFKVSMKILRIVFLSFQV